MMSNLCTTMGGPVPRPPPKKNGCEIFSHAVRFGGVLQTFHSSRPWKGVSITGFKILGAPPKDLHWRVKFSPTFVIFWLFRPFLHNGVRYHQSENGLSNYRHFPTWCLGLLIINQCKRWEWLIFFWFGGGIQGYSEGALCAVAGYSQQIFQPNLLTNKNSVRS